LRLVYNMTNNNLGLLIRFTHLPTERIMPLQPG
jgi:hypothetical protein